MTKAVFFNSQASGDQCQVIDYVYGKGRRERLAGMADLYPAVVNKKVLEERAGQLAGIEVIFSTWGMPELTAGDLSRLPKLRAVFYAAGSVKGFARPLLERGITVCSAWGANAVSVAEFCLGQILLACKGYFHNVHDSRTPMPQRQEKRFTGHGAYGEKIALIGAGQIGRLMIKLLKPFQLEILVVDPFLSDAEARELQVRKVTLEEAFRQAYVVSNHLPNLPHLKHVLGEKLFASMRDHATFINTGRGAQVNEAELIEVLKNRADLMVLLDVTDPEPVPPNSEFYCLPNVRLTGHMAGAHDDEVLRMADYMIEEFSRWQKGEPLRHAITLEMLDRLA